MKNETVRGDAEQGWRGVKWFQAEWTGVEWNRVECGGMEWSGGMQCGVMCWMDCMVRCGEVL